MSFCRTASLGTFLTFFCGITAFGSDAPFHSVLLGSSLVVKEGIRYVPLDGAQDVFFQNGSQVVTPNLDQPYCFMNRSWIADRGIEFVVNSIMGSYVKLPSVSNRAFSTRIGLIIAEPRSEEKILECRNSLNKPAEMSVHEFQSTVPSVFWYYLNLESIPVVGPLYLAKSVRLFFNREVTFPRGFDTIKFVDGTYRNGDLIYPYESAPACSFERYGRNNEHKVPIGYILNINNVTAGYQRMYGRSHQLIERTFALFSIEGILPIKSLQCSFQSVLFSEETFKKALGPGFEITITH